MTPQSAPRMTVPLGIVIRNSRGVTRWARHVRRAVADLFGADRAGWKELRREGNTVGFHAGGGRGLP